MRQLLAIERRLQDVERKLENQQRYGDVSEVKFDNEKRRWFVKMESGEGEQLIKTDWLPWSAFAHGSIKMSIPPRKGMKVVMHSPNGDGELAYAAPYHYGPDAKSPHDKEDEIFLTVEKPGEGGQGAQASEMLSLHLTNGTLKATIGNAVIEMTGSKVKGSVGSSSVEVENGTVTITAGKVKFKKG